MSHAIFRVARLHELLAANLSARVSSGEPRPEGFRVAPDPAVSERHGNIVLGPPR